MNLVQNQHKNGNSEKIKAKPVTGHTTGPGPFEQGPAGDAVAFPCGDGPNTMHAHS
jgi:hypothetical protein